jgi:hypothetical protein
MGADGRSEGSDSSEGEKGNFALFTYGLRYNTIKVVGQNTIMK